METALITLSDSGDESDDLPSFSERVRRLINSESQDVKSSTSPKKRSLQAHSISDSDGSDSRETIPTSTLESRSSVSSLTNVPDHNLYLNRSPSVKQSGSHIHSISDTEDSDSRQTLPSLTLKSMSSVSSLNVPDHNFNVNRSPSVKQSGSQVHSISDNEDSDSRETIPFSREKSVSPVFNFPDTCAHDVNRKFNFSSDDDIPELSKNVKNQKKKRNIEAEKEKELRKKVRLEKKKEKEMIKVLKASEKEILKSQKPEECIKNMKIVLDHNILYIEGSQSALNLLDLNNLKHSIEENNCKYSVNWYRTVINILTSDNDILREEKEELENAIIVIIPNENFLKMVHAFSQKMKGKALESLSLEEFIINIKSTYGKCDITCVTVGFEKYMRNIKEEGSFELKTLAKQIHKNASEEALIELQLQTPVNFNFLENMTDFGNYLCHFTKALAEAPQRKEKQMQKSLAFSWYADIDSNCPVKLSKDSSSFIKLWKQQIQQFQNVGPEVAEAITSRYPSPRSLLKVYKRCITIKDAENILQDIVVRRNYGPLGTQKRIGPELAYKLYLFFTSRDGNKLLKR